MARGKYEASRKGISPKVWILVILLVIGATTGGVAAYLSATTGSVSNQFSAANHPVVTVGADNRVTITDPGYAVYLRAAVVINWSTSDNTVILADVPVENTDYTLVLGDNWKIIDGFYYYKSAIQATTTTAPVVTVTPLTAKDGYQLDVSVIAQTIQAVGQTDAGTPVAAVEAAWGVTPAQITGS